MIPCRIAFAALLVVSISACATTPATQPASTTSPAPPRSAAVGGAVDVAAIRDAARRLDGLRSAFRSCVEAAAGATAATQACIGTEMQYQQGRLNTALAARRANAAGSDVDAVQTQWLVERDRLCGSDAAGVADAQRLQAGICRLEATAARADALAR